MKPETGDIVFISDVHLGGYDPESNKCTERGLLRLLDYCADKNLEIIILGDLFDYWMEYRGKWPKYGENVLNAFEKLTAGKRIHYITGNHDNWTGQRLEKAGFEIEHEYRFLELDGKKIMLLHGDGLKDPDFNLTRPLLNRILRHPAFLTFYKGILPPSIGIRLMKWFSVISKKRETDSNKCSDEMAVWALKRLKKTDTDVIICGHYHKHRFINDPDGLYINLGSFYRHRTIGLYTKTGFHLVIWDDERQVFKDTGQL